MRQVAFDTRLLRQAIRLIGSTRALAERCEVSQAAITNVLSRGTISIELALAIHRATGGKVPASALRPDVWRHSRHVPRDGTRKLTVRADLDERSKRRAKRFNGKD